MTHPEDAIPGAMRLAAEQCLSLHLRAGAVIHVTTGNVELAGAPGWLAEHVYRPNCRLRAGGVFVAATDGWVTLASAGTSALRVTPAEAPPGWWRLIKSRFGRSGLLLGNARPPDTKAAETPVPHATSK
ncbi:hypothetical protein [Cupriavidus sp. RAF12]|uniref:hypothetical protein n=1 Tax=Cupriavidus sp. RAF12 TaxID=3233050 RepID=UPI003F8FB288